LISQKSVSGTTIRHAVGLAALRGEPGLTNEERGPILALGFSCFPLWQRTSHDNI
jgi:hypothetical protein